MIFPGNKETRNSLPVCPVKTYNGAKSVQKVSYMIKSIHFQNFKALRDATLPLGPFTLIVGPNGSGKPTAMQAFSFVRNPNQYDYGKIVTAGLPQPSDVEVQLTHDLNDYRTRSPTSAVLH